MIAPTKIYANAPTLTAEEAADMVVEAIVTKPARLATRLGVFGEVMQPIMPSGSQVIRNTSFRLFPTNECGSNGQATIAARIAFLRLTQNRAVVQRTELKSKNT